MVMRSILILTALLWPEKGNFMIMLFGFWNLTSSKLIFVIIIRLFFTRLAVETHCTGITGNDIINLSASFHM